MNIQPIFYALDRPARMNQPLLSYGVELAASIDSNFYVVYVRVFPALRRIVVARIATYVQQQGTWSHFHNLLMDRAVNEGVSVVYENVQTVGFYGAIIKRSPESLIHSAWLTQGDIKQIDSFNKSWCKPLHFDHLQWDAPCLPDLNILCNPRQDIQQ